MARHAGTSTANTLVEQLMSRNTHRGVATRPVGARMLEDSKAKAVTYALALDDATKHHLSLELPADWREDLSQSTLYFVTTPSAPDQRAELVVVLHRGKTLDAVTKAVQKQVDLVKLRTIRTGIDGVSDGTMRLRGRSYVTRTWTLRTRHQPIAEKRVLLIQIDDAIVELDHTHRQGDTDWDRIVKSIRVKSGAAQDRAFQLQTGEWWLEGTIPGLTRRHRERTPRRLVFDQLDRRGTPTGTWTLDIAPADRRALVDLIAAAQRGMWTARLRRASRGLHWLIYTGRTADQRLRIRAYSRIPGQLDLTWDYVGDDSGESKLESLLGGLRGRGPNQAR
jgi:hypothetical protein